MTKEDKDLLLKDLYARLPYKARGRFSLACDSHSFIYFDCLTLNIVDRFVNSQKSYADEIGAIQLYLRPMDSMTDEEVTELAYEVFQQPDIDIVRRWVFENKSYPSIDGNPVMAIDWLNKRHFDYRGLIERHLALKAKEGMYNN